MGAALDLFETVRDSGILLVLGTDNYAEDLRKGDEFVLKQVQALKQDTHKPLLILWHEIEEQNRKFVRDTFRDFKRYEFEYDGKNPPDGMKETLFRLAGK